METIYCFLSEKIASDLRQSKLLINEYYDYKYKHYKDLAVRSLEKGKPSTSIRDKFKKIIVRWYENDLKKDIEESRRETLRLLRETGDLSDFGGVDSIDFLSSWRDTDSAEMIIDVFTEKGNHEFGVQVIEGELINDVIKFVKSMQKELEKMPEYQNYLKKAREGLVPSIYIDNSIEDLIILCNFALKKNLKLGHQ